MRLWTVHPKYLDQKGLVAVWREALLAQKVLKNETKGYRNHSQLIRFKETKDPLKFISKYLLIIHEESIIRKYRFDKSKIVSNGNDLEPILENSGQLEYEWFHLKRKLEIRDPERFKKLKDIQVPDHHPLFKIQEGGVQAWEKIY